MIKDTTLHMSLAHDSVFSWTKKIVLGLPRPSAGMGKCATDHRHVKKEEVEIGSCARVPSYLAQVQDVSLRYDSLFYESFIFLYNMMICAGVTHRSR